MIILFLSFFILFHGPVCLQAMDSLTTILPAEQEIKLSELNRETLHTLLLRHEHTKLCAHLFDQNRELNDQIDAVIAFLRKIARSANRLTLPHFFELEGDLCLDRTLSSDEFRLFIHNLQNSRKTSAIIILSLPTLSENPILRTDYKPIGLRNLGNSCYINASLQLAFLLAADIFHEPRDLDPTMSRRLFAKLLLAARNASENNNPENLLKLTEALIPFEKQVRCDLFNSAAQDSLHTPVAKAQMDASEFLAFLLDSITSIDQLRKECGDAMPKAPQGNISAYEKESLQLAERFAIRVDSQVRMLGKDHMLSSRKSVHSKLSLTVLKQHTSFSHTLKESLHPEIIENYKIRGSSESVTVSKKAVVQKTGDFIFFDFALTPETIGKPMPFPLAGLPLPPRCEDTSHQEDYELIGIVMHAGSLEGGHYISFVQGFETGKTIWFRCDDTVITPLAEEIMLQIALDGQSDIRYIDDFFVPTTLLYKRSQNPRAHPAAAHTLLMVTNTDGQIEIEQFSCKSHTADEALHINSIKEILLNDPHKKKPQPAAPKQTTYKVPSIIQRSSKKNLWVIIPTAIILAILYAVTNKKADSQKAKKGKNGREKAKTFVPFFKKHYRLMNQKQDPSG